MDNSKNIWFINFGGIGNGIMISPIFKCFEISFPKIKYFHNENEILSNNWFKKKAGLRNIRGFSPNEWRRFEKKYWFKILKFIKDNNIETIINFRNEGPDYDKDYYLFKEMFKRNNLIFIDLDFRDIKKRKRQGNLTKDLLSLIKKNGIKIANYKSPWISLNYKKENIGLGIVASQVNKRWPIEKWIELAKLLSIYKKEKIVLFAGTSKEDLKNAKKIAKSIGINKSKIIHKKSLQKNTIELSKIKCFISNDTGLLHLSCALGTPTIGIYTSTDPKVWSPLTKTPFYSYKNKNMKKCPARKIHCGNCFHYYDLCPCLNEKDSISPRRIFGKVNEFVKIN